MFIALGPWFTTVVSDSQSIFVPAFVEGSTIAHTVRLSTHVVVVVATIVHVSCIVNCILQKALQVVVILSCIIGCILQKVLPFLPI